MTMEGSARLVPSADERSSSVIDECSGEHLRGGGCACISEDDHLHSWIDHILRPQDVVRDYLLHVVVGLRFGLGIDK